MRSVGRVRGGREEPSDDSWDSVDAEIALDESQFGAEALAGLADFSHIEVVFHFNRVPDSEVNSTARHPRGRNDWPRVGIFAQRGKGRPNRIGVTVCRLLSVADYRSGCAGWTPSPARRCWTSSR
jgi:tRNA (Thr-GGU) A37 N-methylase